VKTIREKMFCVFFFFFWRVISPSAFFLRPLTSAAQVIHLCFALTTFQWQDQRNINKKREKGVGKG
jgi:hypothetical protein